MRVLLKFCGLVFFLLAALWVGIALWGSFSPVVSLHYSNDASNSISVFFNDNHDISKFSMAPGETVEFRTAMFPNPDMWILLTFPGHSPDYLELTKPFSRVEVYISPDAWIEHTTIRNDFFSRL